MRNIFWKTAVGALVLLVTLGAGCGQGANKSAAEDSDSESQTEAKDAINPKDVFNDTVEAKMDLTDAKLAKIEQKTKSILKDIFGKIKLNSYITGISGEGTLITEYTANRATKSTDISLLADALKDEGYKADMVGVNSGAAFGLFIGKEYSVQTSYNVGGQIIGVQFMPAASSLPFEQE